MIFEDLGFDAGFELRSSTHCGGGGGKGATCCPVAIFRDNSFFRTPGFGVDVDGADESRSCGGHGVRTSQIQLEHPSDPESPSYISHYSPTLEVYRFQTSQASSLLY